MKKSDIITKIKLVLKWIFISILCIAFILFALSVIAMLGIFLLYHGGIMTLYILGSAMGICLILLVIWLNVIKSVKMAFPDPYDIRYIRKTDKELRTYLFQSCILAFVFAVITFQIFIYIAILYWFYFIFFMLMFSRIWKFHGKNNTQLFSILIITTIVSFIAAPSVRYGLHIILNFFNVY